jgi:colicin import membrane protein
MKPQRAESGRSAAKWVAAILAIAVNLGFVLFLIFHVSWRNPLPETVAVEVYAPPVEKQAPPVKAQPEPPVEPPKPAPPPEPPKVEPPKPAPEPPKPVPKAEAPPKPDIALKEKQAQAERERREREKQEAEKREAERKQQEKREAERKQQEKRLAEARERQALEAAALKAQAEREQLAQKQQIALNAARAKAEADYIRRIQAKIRGNVVLPPDMAGNPEAVFDVVQLPTGEIIDVQLGKSSGVRAYDEAVQRAIIKSSPLPRPDTPDLFQRRLTLKFRPLD